MDNRDGCSVGCSGFPGLIVTVQGEPRGAREVNVAEKMLARGKQVLGLIGGFVAEPTA